MRVKKNTILEFFLIEKMNKNDNLKSMNLNKLTPEALMAFM